MSAARSLPVLPGAAGALVLPLAGLHNLAGPYAAVRLVVLGAALGALTYFDLHERRIPNRVVLPATTTCAAMSLAGGVRADMGLLAGAVLVALLLATSLAAPAVLGMGDVKLGVLILCGLGGAAAVALVTTVELYAVVATMLLIRRGRAALGTSLPVAPMAALGSLIALLL